MNSYDIFVIGLTLVLLLSGAFRGAVRGVFSVLSVAFGVAAAGRWYQEVANILTPYVNSSSTALPLGFLLVYIVTSMGLSLLGRLCTRLVHHAELDMIDRVLGAFLGLAKGVFIAIMITISLLFFLPDAPAFLLHSTLSPPLVVLGDLSLRVAPQDVRHAAEKKNAAFLSQVADRPSRRPQAQGEKKK